MKDDKMDREIVITRLQIIHTWAEFARERDLQFFTAKHLEDIAQWADDAISLLKEREKPDGKCVNKCECWDSAYERGKQDALKEQEARILDLDELEDWKNAVWFEDEYEHECYIALIANVGTYDATFVNAEPGKYHRFDFLREFYKKEWRCWSAEPTTKQRQAVKWE